MAPRGLNVIVVMCLTIKRDMPITTSLGILLVILLPLALWEYIAAMETGS
jgi:hypothetical protein